MRSIPVGSCLGEVGRKVPCDADYPTMIDDAGLPTFRVNSEWGKHVRAHDNPRSDFPPSASNSTGAADLRGDRLRTPPAASGSITIHISAIRCSTCQECATMHKLGRPTSPSSLIPCSNTSHTMRNCANRAFWESEIPL